MVKIWSVAGFHLGSAVPVNFRETKTFLKIANFARAANLSTFKHRNPSILGIFAYFFATQTLFFTFFLG